LVQNHVSLEAKLNFINAKYDFKSNVSNLNSDDFRSLMTSNDQVNNTVKEFVGKLEVVKEELLRFDAYNFGV